MSIQLQDIYQVFSNHKSIQSDNNKNSKGKLNSSDKLEVRRIPTNTLQKELHHMDLEETIVLRIQRERESHLATTYELEGLQRTTHASSERHQWKW